MSVLPMNVADIFALPAHPAADVFPMLAEDELGELAQSIKANGLHHPLVVQEIDGKLWLIDGRNRREACKRAGITPKATPLEEGQDPVVYIVETNINRRHLNKSQRAMTVAMIYPDAKRGIHSELRNSTGDFDKALISRARTVLCHTPDNAELVRVGTMTLDAAYKTAQSVKISAEGEEGVMRKLRAEAPDLADLVNEEKLTLHEAAVALEARKEKERTDRFCTWKVLNSFMNLVSPYKDGDFDHLSGHWEECREVTQKTRQGVIAELERLEKDVPGMLTALRNQED